jgi:hypothetical protein
MFTYFKCVCFCFGEVLSRIGVSTHSASPAVSTALLAIFIIFHCGPISQTLAEFSVILEVKQVKQEAKTQGNETEMDWEYKAKYET